MKKAFSDLCVESYAKFSQVIHNRKGASTVEYVAVLAGAAIIAGVLISSGSDIGGLLTDKIEDIIEGIGG